MGTNHGKLSMAIIRPFRPNLAEMSVYRPFLDRFDLTFYFTGLSTQSCRLQLDCLGLQHLRAVRYRNYTDFLPSEQLRRLIDYKIGFGSYMLSHLREVLDHDYINVVDPVYAFTHQITRSIQPHQKLIVVRWENMYGRYDRIWMAARHAARVLERADYIICTSKASLYTLLPPNGFSGKISQIYPGIELQSITDGNADLRGGSKQSNRSTSLPTILFVGRLQWAKGLHTLLVALSILHRQLNLTANLWVVGGGKSAPYQRLAKDLGLEQQVTFWSQLSNEMVRRKMREADLFCFPSLLSTNWMEQFGFALVEAMAHGLPVVAFDSGSIREICGEDGVYASAGNAYALAQGIAKLITDSACAAAVGQRLRSRAFQEFDAEKQGMKMLEIIR
jgi:glycosyltransferase involved in cell wall biosynthesis